MSTIAAINFKNPSSASNNVVLNSDGTTTIASPSNIIKSGTSVASTSGTSIDFTSIPSWVKRITVMFNGVSTSGGSVVQVQPGAGSVQTSGYAATGLTTTNAGVVAGNSFTSGFAVEATTASTTAATIRSGALVLNYAGGNVWSATGQFAHTGTTTSGAASGTVTLSGTLDRIRITTVNGTDTFDAGSINILYEG
jgi:hypothetical protein